MQKYAMPVDLEKYADVVRNRAGWTPCKALQVAPCSGGALEVGRGQVLRISLPEGGQTCDFNAFSTLDPSEYFWSGRTRILEGAHLTTGNRLWSTRVRPMFTLIGDSLAGRRGATGGKAHDLLYARCCKELWQLTTGEKNPPNCQDNLQQAAAAFGIGKEWIHDAFNVFMTTGFSVEDDKLFYDELVAGKGDFIELIAEQDCIVAVSACPTGDGRKPPKRHPLLLELFDVRQAAR